MSVATEEPAPQKTVRRVVSPCVAAGAVALVPGGLGFTEASMTGLLQSFGAPALNASRAVATTAVVRLTTLWWAVAVGLVALLLGRRRRGASTVCTVNTG